MFRYFALYKPFEMLSQFTTEGNHKTLADLKFPFPPDVYPVGRLDTDSEGLLLLTNDNRINSRLLNPQFSHKRKYFVQVEGSITDEALSRLKKGILLNDKGNKYTTLPADGKVISEPELPPREPPVRFRKNIPTSWIEISLVEGKNRQVRKMTAAIGFPTLRLVRCQIEELKMEIMEPGRIEEFKKHEFYSKLKLKL